MQVLKRLSYAQDLRFNELKPFAELENSQLTFHLKQLQKQNLIEKNNENAYRLSKKGKVYVNRIETETTQISKQGKISVLLICLLGNEKVLFYTRKRQPFYDHQGFPAGKVKAGEQVQIAAKRELYEETSLSGEPELFRIEHDLVYDEATGKLLADNYFYMFRVINPTGEITPNDEGIFEWIHINKINEYLQKPFSDFEEMKKLVAKAQNFDGNLEFDEVFEETNSF